MTSYLYEEAPAAERRRLDALGELFDAGTKGHLADLGIEPGWRCWEVGAGSGTIVPWLAEQVGPSGLVLATDVDPRFVASLADGNVEVLRHDVVADPLPEEVFDVIHARALIEHLPDRVEVLAKLAGALRPGGWLLVEDVVMMPPACHPPLPVVAKVIEAFVAGFRMAGAEPDYGLQLPGDLGLAGLADVGSQARVPLVSSGTPSADFHLLSLEHLRGLFVSAGLLTDDEIDEALRGMREPGTTTLGPIMVAAWGRREQ